MKPTTAIHLVIVAALAMLSLAAASVYLDCAETDGRAGRFTLSFLRVKLAVHKDDAFADEPPIHRSFSIHKKIFIF